MGCHDYHCLLKPETFSSFIQQAFSEQLPWARHCIRLSRMQKSWHLDLRSSKSGKEKDLKTTNYSTL